MLKQNTIDLYEHPGLHTRLAQAIKQAGGLKVVATCANKPFLQICRTIETGKVPLDFIHLIAKRAGVSPAWVVTGNSERTQEIQQSENIIDFQVYKKKNKLS